MDLSFFLVIFFRFVRLFSDLFFNISDFQIFWSFFLSFFTHRLFSKILRLLRKVTKANKKSLGRRLYLVVLDYFEQFYGVNSAWLPSMCGLKSCSPYEAQQCTLCCTHGPTISYNCHFCPLKPPISLEFVQ